MPASLYASAGTLEDIRQAVCRFYCGESKTLIPTSANTWKVVGTHSGKQVEGVHIVRKRGRFRFETS